MALLANEEFQHILRLLNTNVNGKQKIMFAMTSIKGIGRRYANICCKKADIDMNKSLHVTQVIRHGLNTWNSTHTSHNGRHSSLSTSATLLAGSFVSTEVHKNQCVANGGTITEGHQSLTRVFPGALDNVKGNVHSGATPPWLEGIEPHGNNGEPSMHRVNSAAKNNKKTSKLNPNRVGAAWAEKRKIELEREKRGEIIANGSAADWLPNFGRVWKSGSRKESMKEFKKEKLNLPKAENQDTTETKIRPYVNKRMRRDSNGVSSEGVQNGADIC